MQRWSISEFSTFRWSLEEEIENFQYHGFQNIGIWNQKLNDYELDECEDHLFESQFNVSSYSWIGGFTGSEGVSHIDAIENAKRDIRVASRIGANTVIVYPGSRNGHTAKHAQRLLTSALNELIPCAIDYGVRLALEPMEELHSESWNLFRSPKETLDYVHHFDSRALAIVLDLYHIGLNSCIFEELDELINRVALVQLADRKLTIDNTTRGQDQSRMLILEGNVPVLDWISRLEQVGYEGFYELELFGPLIERVEYDTRLVHSRRTLDQIANTMNSTLKTMF